MRDVSGNWFVNLICSHIRGTRFGPELECACYMYLLVRPGGWRGHSFVHMNIFCYMPCILVIATLYLRNYNDAGWKTEKIRGL